VDKKRNNFNTTMNSSLLKISIPAIIACILWATAFPVIKIGLLYCKPLPFAGLRFIISGLMLLLFVILINKKTNISLSLSFQQWKTVFCVSIFQTVLLYALFFVGMTYVSSAVAAIIIGSSPLITALTAHVITHDDKITKAKLTCIITGTIGIVIITLNKSPLGQGSYIQVFGIFILILSSISSAIGNIIVSKDKQAINPIVLTSYQMFIGGFILLGISMLFHGIPPFVKEPVFYIAVFWLDFLSAVAFSIWFWLLQKPDVQVSELNIWKFIIPVFGVVLSWILIPEEHPSLIILIGMLIAAFSVLLYNLPGKKNSTHCMKITKKQ
jgi:drug/metabolite transporter (DMT)-like permease